MALSWQTVRLAPPPNISHVTNSRDVLSLKKVCSSFLKILLNQKSLHVEAALLSRIIYRMKTKFRHDKGFQSMEKVNRCLLQYLRLNLASVYANFTSCIRASYEGDMPLELSNNAHAPSRQMLEFLIIRTLGFTKILCKAVQYCEEAAVHLKNRIYIGHSWNYALVAVSIIARIWCLSKYLVLCACDHYKNIVPFVDKLEYIGHLWNGFDTRYPVDVERWLNVWWINAKSQHQKKGTHQDEKTYLERLFLDTSSESASMEVITKETLNQFNQVRTDADLGEPIERSSIVNQRLFKKNPKPSDASSEHHSNKEKNINHFQKVTSSKDLLKFIKKEEKMRSEQNDYAITKDMDKFQFNLFIKKVHKYIKKLKDLDHQKGTNEFDLALRKCKKILNLYIQ